MRVHFGWMSPVGATPGCKGAIVSPTHYFSFHAHALFEVSFEHVLQFFRYGSPQDKESDGYWYVKIELIMVGRWGSIVGRV